MIVRHPRKDFFAVSEQALARTGISGETAFWALLSVSRKKRVLGGACAFVDNYERGRCCESAPAENEPHRGRRVLYNSKVKKLEKKVKKNEKKSFYTKPFLNAVV